MNFNSIKEKFSWKTSSQKNTKEVLGVAFGSGGARGWCHIGAIMALNELGIKPKVVTGTSIGAVAAAIYALGTVDKVIEFAKKLTPIEAASLFVELRIPHNGGLLEGKRAMKVLSKFVPNVRIESLDIKFGAVAADLYKEEEVLLTTGSISDAIRASISIPGIFTPVKKDSRYLVDGALINPVPVNLARKLGATKVIAINVNSELHEDLPKKSNPPSLFDIIQRTWRLAERIAVDRSLSKQSPDILIEPLSKNFSTFDFSKSNELIAAGYDAVKLSLLKG